MTPTITAGLVVSVLALGGGGIGAWTALNNNVTENKILIRTNTEIDRERQENLREDLRELKDNDKQIQVLLRKILEK